MSTDSQLQQAVVEELSWEPSVVSAHIGVAAASGIVTLTGHVLSYAQKHAAETATRRVRGVKAVDEEIEVRLPFETKRTDSDLAAAAIDRMGWDVSIPKDAGKVQVENGWVTLTGQVDWYYQKDAAGQELRHLSGVTGLSDQITVKPRVDVATSATASRTHCTGPGTSTRRRSWSARMAARSTSAAPTICRMTASWPPRRPGQRRA